MNNLIRELIDAPILSFVAVCLLLFGLFVCAGTAAGVLTDQLWVNIVVSLSGGMLIGQLISARLYR